MIELIGCETKWECPSCGNNIKKHQPLWSSAHRKIEGPTSCDCGRKGKFRLFEIAQCAYDLKDKDKNDYQEETAKEDSETGEESTIDEPVAEEEPVEA